MKCVIRIADLVHLPQTVLQSWEVFCLDCQQHRKRTLAHTRIWILLLSPWIKLHHPRL